MRVEGLAVLAEVEVDTVGATVADATDGHYVAGITGDATVDVRVTFRLVLRSVSVNFAICRGKTRPYFCDQIKQVQ